MFKKLFLFLLVSLRAIAKMEDLLEDIDQNIILSMRRYDFEKFPGAFNPSICKIEGGYLLSFRYCPDLGQQFWLSNIGIVMLDESLNPVSEPQLLNTRPKKSKTPSQSEDARFFSYLGRIYFIYNDNIDEIFFDHSKRRDLFVAELTCIDGRFNLSPPIKLFCEEKYPKFSQQKNWVPFEWNKDLYFLYSICPQEVVTCNCKNGYCYSTYKAEPKIHWPYGNLRGSSSATLVDGEYLAFFHSGCKIRSDASVGLKVWHYFAGAFTFSSMPPFEITKVSRNPIMCEGLYTQSITEKRVIFPGGYVVADSRIYMAYGKNDCEVWIATIDKDALLKSLIPVGK